jgi:hypothetical protein
MMKTKPLPDPASIAVPSINSDPQYAALLDQQAALEKRLAVAQQRLLRAQALARGAPAGRSPIARAKDLLLGGVVSATDPAREQEAANREIHEILKPALMALNEQLESRRGELSYEMCKKLQSIHNDALAAAYRAAQEMHSAFSVAIGIRARVRSAGADPLEGVLFPYLPPGAALLGDGISDGKQLVMWRQLLEMRGLKL